MTITKEEINFVLPTNHLYVQGKKFWWRGSSTEALSLLRDIPYFKNSSTLFNTYPPEESLMSLIGTWDLEDLAKSAIFFLLEKKISRIREKESKALSIFEWQRMSSLIINSSISTSILDFINQLNLKAISKENTILIGSQRAIGNIYDFERQLPSKSGLENLLTFLEIDLVSIDLLVKEALQKKDTENISNFLATFEKDYHKHLVFTEKLKSYKKHKDLPYFRKSIDTLFNDVYKNELSDLETFDVFDLFDSAEFVKSKSSNLWILSFYEELLNDIEVEDKSVVILLFQLFEEYLLSSKDRVHLFSSESLKSTAQIMELNDRFFLVKKDEIISILEKSDGFLKKFLREFRITELVFIIIMITFTISKGFGFAPLSEESQKSYSPPYAMISPMRVASFSPHTDPHPPVPVQTITPSTRQETTATSTEVNQGPPVASSTPSSAMPALGGPMSTARKGVSSHSSQPASAKAQALQSLGSAGQAEQVAAPQDSVQEILDAATRNTQSPLLDKASAKAKAKKVADYLNNSSQSAHGLPLNAQINITDNNNGVWTTNILNSEGSFYELGKLLKRYPNAIKLTDFTPAARVLIHKEHFTNSSILKGLTIRRGDGAAYVMLADHHLQHTKDYAVLWSQNISYVLGGGKGDLLDQIDIYEINYKEAQVKMYRPGSKYYKDLDYYGTDLSGSKQAVTFGFARDRDTIANMGVQREVLLPWSHCNNIAQAQTENIREFIEWGNAGESRFFNGAEAKKVLTTALIEGKNVTDHIRAVRPILTEGSLAAQTTDRILTDFYVAAAQAIDLVEQSGHSINSKLQDNFFKPKGAPLDLEQAEVLTRTTFNRTDVLEGVPSIFPANFKQKGNKLSAPVTRNRPN